MGLLLDSFWRAAGNCLQPRVIALSLLPLAVMGALSFGLGYFYWDTTLESVRGMLDGWGVRSGLGAFLEGWCLGGIEAVLAPLLVVFAIVPVIAVLSVAVVAVLMAPALVRLVALQRFPALERKQGGSLAASLAWSLGSTVLALLALVASVPLWLVPPLALVLPPLIWGWLTARVMAFDALAEHASREERHEILRRHRGKLLAIGVASGYIAAAPGLLWASGALFAVFFVVLVPVAIWAYSMVLAFSALWFIHYCLGALEALRAGRVVAQ